MTPLASYQSQNATLTLAQGLAEYYAAFPDLKRGPDLSPEAQDFFQNHDAVHVVYGCDVSLTHEAIVKLSSFFGTDGGAAVMRGYRLYESLDIYRSIPFSDIVWTIALSPYLVARTIWRCRQQRARWPWAEFQKHLNTPLNDLRAAFAIRVA